MSLSESNFSDEQMQECCVRGFSLIPMRRTCQERVKRVSMVKNNPACADTFLKCCLEGQRLRQKKIRDDAEKGLGRSEIKLSCGHQTLYTPAKLTYKYVPCLSQSVSFFPLFSCGSSRHWAVLLGHWCSIHSAIFPSELWIHNIWYKWERTVRGWEVLCYVFFSFMPLHSFVVFILWTGCCYCCF